MRAGTVGRYAPDGISLSLMGLAGDSCRVREVEKAGLAVRYLREPGSGGCALVLALA